MTHPHVPISTTTVRSGSGGVRTADQVDVLRRCFAEAVRHGQ